MTRQVHHATIGPDEMRAARALGDAELERLIAPGVVEGMITRLSSFYRIAEGHEVVAALHRLRAAVLEARKGKP